MRGDTSPTSHGPNAVARHRSILKRTAGRTLETYVLFPLFAVLLLSVIWLGTDRLIRVESASVQRAALDSSRELVETYEAQIIRNLGGIDQTLKTIDYAYDVQKKRSTLFDLQQAGLLPSTLIFRICVTNGDGKIIASTHADHAGDVSQQAYFQAHRANTSTFPIVTVVPLPNNKWQMQFSRRLNAPDGSFNGIAIASVDPDYFTSGYDHTRLGDHGVLGLLNADGRFLVKRSGDRVSWGESAADVLSTIGDSSDSQLLLNRWDGVERYTNARRLYNFPLAVVVGLSLTEQSEVFQRQKKQYIWGATVASALLIAITLMLTRMSWQLAKSRMRTRKDQETYYAASEASLDAVFVLRSLHDSKGDIRDFILDNANNRGASMFGRIKSDLLGKRLCQLLPQSRTNGLFDTLVTVAQTGVVHELEWKNDMPDVQAAWLYRQIVHVEDGVVVIIRDISERKQTEERISHMAHHDALTGLPNRTLLEDRIQQAMLHAQRYGRCVTVVFMDLDNFKLINDTLGHKAGDELLKTVADRMVRNVRQTDSVMRLGGDEFVLVLADQSDRMETMTPTLQKLREAIAEPIYIGEQKLEVTSSMGLAIYPADGTDSDTLLMHADAAMYQAKALGRNNYQFYTAEMNTRVQEKLLMQEGLRNALLREEFFLAYQPQIDMQSGQVIGMEALIRWQHPEKGVVAPNEFICLAEETGLIVPIGEWVLHTACRQAKTWQEAGMAGLRVSVNISARQFRDNVLTAQVTQALRESGLQASYLDLELTESLIMQNLQQAVSTMQELTTMGVQLSIDDFGTGYSNLSALKSFPITRLKLDRSFVHDLPENEDDKAITRAMILLAHELKLRVVAEGVEAASQHLFLQSIGCDEMQGYYFSRPLPAHEVETFLHENMHTDHASSV
jgi:diguanylate cyclase (GGDEF)-like protein